MCQLSLGENLSLLYQLEPGEGGMCVCDLHMVLRSASRSLRKNIFRTGKFYRPEGCALWHASVSYGGLADLEFCVANALQAPDFEKYSGGGNFEVAFAGLGDCLECMNDRGVVRFYDGNPVEMERAKKNDPTIDHADVVFSEVRALNPVCGEAEPALAEFSGVVEACETVKLCGQKCYRLRLMSGAPESPSSFMWELLVSAHRVVGKYVPRVGDSVHGGAYMFGTFYGDAQKEPTIYLDRDLLDLVDEVRPGEPQKPSPEGESGADPVDASPEAVTDGGARKGVEWLPREPLEYPEARVHGGGLAKSVVKHLPKFVVYGDYRKHIRGELTPLKHPGRKELARILDSIDYVIASKGNLHVFGSVQASVGIRHFVADGKTGERHLWCCLPSGFGDEHFLTNLLVALDESGNVLRYTFHMGAWDWRRLCRGMQIETYSHAKNKFQFHDSIAGAIRSLPKMGKEDFIVVYSLGHTSLLQACCDEVVDDVQQWTIEWQVHYLPWQFYLDKGSREQLVAMLKEFDKHGIEPVETMAVWKWRSFAGNA